MSDIRLIAMYLPQYHPIPENDRWWGEGFTEWTNVRKAQPRFAGHYQPHIPGKLGYYDLRDPIARQEQAELAREHGIHGFCYYHYWFNGKRLLERPFKEVLASGKPDFPFCICWANENWTRRWDGSENEILMAQQYSDEDSLNFINDLIPAFRDERYIRVNGKPLLLIYRTALFPDPLRTASIWREAMEKAGIGDIYLVRVENFIHHVEEAPASLGFDAAMEFAPYWGSAGDVLTDLSGIGASGVQMPPEMLVYDYETCMRNMLARPTPPYKLFRGVFPGWDNSARRRTRVSAFVNNSAEKYAYWLSLVLRQTIEQFSGDERLVFVNAWNEWGEGCHLEPDEQHGMKFLEATSQALDQSDLYARIRAELMDDGFDYGRWYNSLGLLRGSVDDEVLETVLAGHFNLLWQKNSTSEEEIRQLLSVKDNLLSAYQNSISWKITAPLRRIFGDLYVKMLDRKTRDQHKG